MNKSHYVEFGSSRIKRRRLSAGQFQPMLKIAKFLLIAVVVAALLFGANTFFRPIVFAPTVDVDESLPSITLNGYTYHSETMGAPENPVIIALHGGPGGDYQNLLPIAPLSDEFYLVFYDQRMTGLSSRQFDGVLDLESYFIDLDAFVDHFGKGQKVILLGHSWGAMMASGYVSRHPEKVEKIILVEPGLMRPDLSQPFFEAQSPPGWSAYPALAWIWLNSWRVQTTQDTYARDDYILSKAYPHLPGKGVHCGDAIPQDFKGWRASRTTLDQTVIAYANDPALLAKLDFVTEAHRFGGKTLIIGTTCNTVYGSDYQKRHLPFFQDARLETIESAGHFVFYDQAQVALKVIRTFLAE